MNSTAGLIGPGLIGQGHTVLPFYMPPVGVPGAATNPLADLLPSYTPPFSMAPTSTPSLPQPLAGMLPGHTSPFSMAPTSTPSLPQPLAGMLPAHTLPFSMAPTSTPSLPNPLAGARSLSGYQPSPLTGVNPFYAHYAHLNLADEAEAVVPGGGQGLGQHRGTYNASSFRPQTSSGPIGGMLGSLSIPPPLRGAFGSVSTNQPAAKAPPAPPGKRMPAGSPSAKALDSSDEEDAQKATRPTAVHVHRDKACIGIL